MICFHRCDYSVPYIHKKVLKLGYRKFKRLHSFDWKLIQKDNISKYSYLRLRWVQEWSSILSADIVGNLLNRERKGIREWSFTSPPKGYWILRDRQRVFGWDLRPTKRSFNHFNWVFGHFFSESRLFALKINERTTTRVVKVDAIHASKTAHNHSRINGLSKVELFVSHWWSSGIWSRGNTPKWKQE
jgi:hypothetical protein